MLEKISGIYCIDNLISGKKYIGQSIDIRRRFNSHKCGLRNNKHTNEHLQNAWNKYGEENFTFSALKLCNKDELDLYERHYISKFDTYANGYNRDTGGCQTKFITTEARQKFRCTINHRTQKELDLIKETYRKAHEFESIKIEQLNIDGSHIKSWASMREASKKLDISFSCIYQCVYYNRKTYKNCLWVKTSDYINGIDLSCYIPKTNPKPKEVVQLDYFGHVIKIWESITSIRKSTGFKDDGIIGCCKHRLKCNNNYIWRYYDDYLKNDIAPELLVELQSKLIKQYDINHNYLKCFYDMKSVCTEFNISYKKIRSLISNKTIIDDKFYFAWG